MPDTANAENFVFDDDTSDSDSDGELQLFQNKIAGLTKVNKSENVQDNEDGNQEESEDDSDENSDDSDENCDSDENGDDNEDCEEESSDNNVKHPRKVLTEENKGKLSKLQQQLHQIGEGSDSESESEDDTKDHLKLEKKSNTVSTIKISHSEKNEEERKPLEKKRKHEEKADEEPKSIAKKVKQEESSNPVKPSGEERAKKRFREQLSQMSIEEIHKLKERLGLKLFDQKMSGTAPEKGRIKEFKRENKNRPREMSSKKTVGRFREVVQVAKVERRDPRFDPLCGEFDDKIFKESYQFVNEIKSKELGELKKQIRTEEDPEKRKNIKYLIQRIENQLRSEAQNQVKKAQEASDIAERKEKLKAGEKPHYVSKAKQKEAKLVEQYERLKEKGGLDTFIKKKTKKNLSKERKKGLGVL